MREEKMREKNLIARLVDYKLRHDELPQRMCRRCGNTEYFVGTVLTYHSVLIRDRGPDEEHQISRDCAEFAYRRSAKLTNFGKKELGTFLRLTENDELMQSHEMTGVYCMRCGSEPEDVLTREQLKNIIGRRCGARRGG
jgi:hypothetical protein